MKFQRQLKVLEIIEKYPVETQDELSEKLKESGFEVTQATVSRDIKELRLIKILSNNGTYRYAASSKEENSALTSKLRIIFRESVISVDYAINTVVIKTLPGMAQAAAAAIDAMNWTEIVGTLAGDDTIFSIFKNEEAALNYTEELNKMLK